MSVDGDQPDKEVSANMKSEGKSFPTGTKVKSSQSFDTGEKVVDEILSLLNTLYQSCQSLLKSKLSVQADNSQDGVFGVPFTSTQTDSVGHPTPVYIHGDPPRLPTFSRSKASKGEVSYHQWRYEVMCLLEGQSWPEHLVLQAIRRSPRGIAGEALLNLFMKVTVLQVVSEFDSMFGNVSTPEQLIESFILPHKQLRSLLLSGVVGSQV